MTQHVWTYPGSLLDMVKALMLTYRQALLDRDPDACAVIDARAHDNPRTSALLPTYAPYDPDELVSDADGAHLAGLAPATIRKWASDGLIDRYTGADGSRMYKLGEIQNVKHSRIRKAS